ncbi:MAG: hypothetical protein L0221_14765, partial [Chloroflexi bacterium]|nr:hypothetical protein [Chloroflexota bacterium]
DVEDADFSTDVRKQATLTWAEYFGYAKVSGLAESIAAANAGEGEDLLLSESKDAIEELSVKLSEHTYSGSVDASPTELEGLARAVDSTGTYAALAAATYTEWASGEDTLATASLSLANLRTKLHRKFKDGCGIWPEFVTCSGTLFDLVCGLYNDQSRIMVTEIHTSARGNINLKAVGGFRAVEVDGIPYIEDRHATASTFYANHSANLSYRQVPKAGSAASPEQVRAAIKALTGDDLPLEAIAEQLKKGSSRLQPWVKALAATGDSTKLMIGWYGQLRVKHRNRASKLLLT